MTVELFLVLPIAILVLVASIQLIGVARARIELQGAVREGLVWLRRHLTLLGRSRRCWRP